MPMRLIPGARASRLVAAAVGGSVVVGLLWGAGLLLNFAGATATALAAVVGGGGVASLVLTYRSHRLAETADRREEGKVFHEKFGAAAAQIGSEQIHIKLGGVQTLARLADEWAIGRQQCIDLLCASLRRPWAPEPTRPPDEGPPPFDEHRAWKDDQEFRHTIIRIVSEHLRADAEVSWHPYTFDFSGAVFDGADFSRVVLSNGTFNFSRCVFLSGETSFRAAEFSGDVSFEGARFARGRVSFRDIKVTGGTVNFKQCIFEDADIDFFEATLQAGTVSFEFARFADGNVDFSSAVLAGSHLSFSHTLFDGSTVRLYQATLSDGELDFNGARLEEGILDLTNIRLVRGILNFQQALFGGCDVVFSSAIFDDIIADFRYSRFAPGTISFKFVRFNHGSTVLFAHTVWDGAWAYFTNAIFFTQNVSFDSAIFKRGTLDLTEADLFLPEFTAEQMNHNVVKLPKHVFSKRATNS